MNFRRIYKLTLSRNASSEMSKQFGGWMKNITHAIVEKKSEIEQQLIGPVSLFWHKCTT